jgi:acyl dehydratase
MSKQAISKDIVGMQFDPVPVTWTDNDTMLYALAVGCNPEDELDYVYEKFGPRVIPTYGVIPALNALSALESGVEFDVMNILHGEQTIEMFRPIPPQTKHGIARGSIPHVYDKGKAAVIVVACEVSDEDGPICKSSTSIFVRNGGGFGGERGPSTQGVNEPPERHPDHCVEDQTLPQQAALYRLTGDRVPLHIDPEFAQMAGFDKPFLHGLCTYGFVCRAVLKSLCDNDPANLLSLSGRFADQVWCGDRVITRIWKTGKGEAIVRAETQTGAIAISQGKVTYKES